jgi:outer membrane lipoprotein-sorting protein
MKYIIIPFLFISIISFGQYPEGKEVLKKIDENMSSESRMVLSKMVIHGRRGSRTIESRSWSEGEDNSFTEYLSPPREKGVKMLKLKDNLWMYSPSTDRTIQISGHMLRQSVMGSDLSYEDMMDDRKLMSDYEARVTGEETVESNNCWIVELTAITEDVAYYSRKMWVDKDKYIPVRSELYAKSGKLLKRLEMFDIVRMENRWYPSKMVFKDMLKEGDGTEFIVDEIQFNVDIPPTLLTKASLRK